MAARRLAAPAAAVQQAATARQEVRAAASGRGRRAGGGRWRGRVGADGSQPGSLADRTRGARDRTCTVCAHICTNLYDSFAVRVHGAEFVSTVGVKCLGVAGHDKYASQRSKIVCHLASFGPHGRRETSILYQLVPTFGTCVMTVTEHRDARLPPSSLRSPVPRLLSWHM